PVIETLVPPLYRPPGKKPAVLPAIVLPRTVTLPPVVLKMAPPYVPAWLFSMTLPFWTVRLAVHVPLKQLLTIAPPRPLPMVVVGALLPRIALLVSVIAPALYTPPPSPTTV